MSNYFSFKRSRNSAPSSGALLGNPPIWCILANFREEPSAGLSRTRPIWCILANFREQTVNFNMAKIHLEPPKNRSLRLNTIVKTRLRK